MQDRRMPLRTIFALIAAMALSACDQQEEPKTPGERLDAAIAQTQEKADEAVAEAKKSVDQAQSEITAAANDVGAKVEAAVDDAGAKVNATAGEVREQVSAAAGKVGGALGDAAVVTAVKAALLKDGELSALNIKVDAKDGQVTLTGAVPNEAAKDRAADLVEDVEGVTDVDNDLTVQ